MPLDTDGLFSLIALQDKFPNAIGLGYTTETGIKVEDKTGNWNEIRLLGNKLVPPLDGWGISDVYIAVEEQPLLNVIQEKQEEICAMFDTFNALICEKRYENYELIIDLQKKFLADVERHVQCMKNMPSVPCTQTDATLSLKEKGPSNKKEMLKRASQNISDEKTASKKVKFCIPLQGERDERKLLHVSNIDKNCSNSRLSKFLENSIGLVRHRLIIRNDTPDDTSIRYAILAFESEEAETKALQERHVMDGTELHIHVQPRNSDIAKEYYKTREERKNKRQKEKNYYKSLREEINSNGITKSILKTNGESKTITRVVGRKYYYSPQQSSSTDRFKATFYQTYSSRENYNERSFNQHVDYIAGVDAGLPNVDACISDLSLSNPYQSSI